MTTTLQLNRVDLGAVTGLVNAISAHPEKAQTTWSSEVSWSGAFQSEAKIRAFEPVPSDEPPTLGGSDTAPNPVELLLSAFGSCLAVGYAANASVAGIEIKSLTIGLEGDLDLHVFLGLADGHAGFSSIRATVDLDSDADADAIAELHRKVAATSPVGHTLETAVPVTISAS
ncbi:OsmC family protein [Antrihabitans stalactiti]|uniref:OsmC family protein n=1 Tax=Antrihabitans stalactiti TaxID=2584121 RepID=A0A848K5Q6_9NOCA|nr:OsmC family protein [Antrihabitans stalactiti]NMN93729.1 OsmC family protein [Antrihabitans stalactiti]